MEFTVSKVDLIRELALAQGVVEKKTTIPVLSNVLLEAGEGRIVLTSTDLELGIRSSCPAEVQKAGSGTIPARRLLDYVRLLPDAAIHVKFGQNQWAQLMCGRSKTRIAGMSRESFPELPEMPEPVMQVPVSVLATLISRTIFAISAEESRFTLNGALMLVKPDGLVMVSTDGHRLALCERAMSFAGDIGGYRALVPRKAMQELLRLSQELDPEATVEFAGSDNHLFFRTGDRLLVSRKLTGNFPDYERVLPGDQPHAIEMQRDELRATVERTAQFSDERSHAIRFQLTAGELKVYSSLSDTGETEETLPITYEGDKVEIGFNAQYLVDFMRAISEETVIFRFRDAGNAGELQPGGETSDYRYRYVVMPMRI